jgi:hypothetical protein
MVHFPHIGLFSLRRPRRLHQVLPIKSDHIDRVNSPKWNWKLDRLARLLLTVMICCLGTMLFTVQVMSQLRWAIPYKAKISRHRLRRLCSNFMCASRHWLFNRFYFICVHFHCESDLIYVLISLFDVILTLHRVTCSTATMKLLLMYILFEVSSLCKVVNTICSMKL